MDKKIVQNGHKNSSNGHKNSSNGHKNSWNEHKNSWNEHKNSHPVGNIVFFTGRNSIIRGDGHNSRNSSFHNAKTWKQRIMVFNFVQRNQAKLIKKLFEVRSKVKKELLTLIKFNLSSCPLKDKKNIFARLTSFLLPAV